MNLNSQTNSQIKFVQQQFSSGVLTNGERYNKVIDIWSRTSEEVVNKEKEKLSSVQSAIMDLSIQLKRISSL